MSTQTISPDTSTSSPAKTSDHYIPFPVRIAKHGMPPQARALAAQLHALAWRTGYITWTIPYLAECCGMSKSTLHKWLDILHFFGFVRSISDTQTPSGRRIVLTWLQSKAPEHIGESEYTDVRVLGPLLLNRDRESKKNDPEKKEAIQRQRQEPTPETCQPQEAAPQAPEEDQLLADVPTVQVATEAPGAAPGGCQDYGLTTQEQERLAQLTESSRGEVLTMLKTGDNIIIKEARNRLRPVEPPRADPTSTPELIERVHERPDYVPRLAAVLQREMRDTATKQWGFWMRVATDLSRRRLDAQEVIRIYEYATRPDVPMPGNYFARAWARLRLTCPY